MMTDTNRDELVADLVEKAEIQGYLTSDEILETMPEAEDLKDQFDELLTLLQDAGVDILDNRGDAEDNLGVKDDDSPEEDEHEDEDELIDLSGIASDDTVG